MCNKIYKGEINMQTGNITGKIEEYQNNIAY